MDWAACAELLRLQQWQMSQRILATADALYQQVRLDPGPATASLDHRASRMVQIAIKLGRQAAGMDLKPAIPTGPPPLTPEEQADVDAFYPATPAPTPPPPPAPTASANVTPPVAPAPPQPGPAGSTLNPARPRIQNRKSKFKSPPTRPRHSRSLSRSGSASLHSSPIGPRHSSRGSGSAAAAPIQNRESKPKHPSPHSPHLSRRLGKRHPPQNHRPNPAAQGTSIAALPTARARRVAL